MEASSFYQLTEQGEQAIQSWVSDHDKRNMLHTAYLDVAEATADENFNEGRDATLEVLAANSVSGQAVIIELKREWFTLIKC